MSINDYEIIQNLGKETKNLLLTKVRSIKDNKIYCMRKIKNEEIKADNLKNQLKEINNPHIIQYYDAFNDNNNEYICIIMEYIDTDIKDFIETYNITNQKVPEETIIFLLLQCLSALKYLHSKKLYFSGIRLSNILMPNEKSIKISIIKNTLPKDWQPKDDIKLIYKYFELMMFPEIFKHGQGIMAYLSDPKNNDYNKELREIIYDMDTKNHNIKDIFKTTCDFYINKYELSKDFKNSCIKSILKCLSYYSKLNELLGRFSEVENDMEKLYMLDLFDKIKKEDNNYYRYIEEFRRFIALEFPTFNTNKELSPYIVVSFILKKMEPFKIKNKKKEEEEIIISEFFSNVKLIEKTCKTCGDIFRSQEKDNIVTFDLTGDKKEFFNIKENGFNSKIENDSKGKKFFCENCLTYKEYKFDIPQNYFNDYLIIYFDRGNDYSNEKAVKIEKDLDLNKDDNSKETNIYKLIGGINIIKKNGIFFFKSFKFNVNENENKSKNIIMLFYQKS